MQLPSVSRGLLAGLALAACLPAPAVVASRPSVEAERQLFREVYLEAERGDWGPAGAAAKVLEDYPLWPDLRLAWILARIDEVDAAEVSAWLDAHGRLPPAARLRGRWINELARRGDWKAFLALYDARFAADGIVRLDCLAAMARYREDASYRLPEPLADRLWVAGRSQPKECDPVFERMRGDGQLTAERFRARFRAALDEREFRLARYLARDMDEAARAEVIAWQAMERDPAAELARMDPDSADASMQERLDYGIRLLARRDPAYAAQLWDRLASRFAVSGIERWEIAGYVGVRAAVSRDPAAAGLLKAVPLHLADESTRTWRVRAAIRRGDWEDAILTIRAMPDDEAGRTVWRYWLARALSETGEREVAEPIFAALAAERSYHGFMAADALGLPYAFGHAPIAGDEAALAALREDPAIRRAEELFRVGLESQGRSEWDAATRTLPAELRIQAAVLAHRWGWHSRAIATAASVGHYDDLDLRYPLAWRETFESLAAAANIREAWALGIARSESLFMADIRSRAGAVGVMQLMPTTGRQMAREARLPYRGWSTLTDPRTNIELGTRYLGTVYERFASNPVLATAAYNAGPHRVERWLPEDGALAADVWIETIPFAETREYVKRVLTADSIFSWRLTGREQRLSALHPPVRPAADTRVAAAE